MQNKQRVGGGAITAALVGGVGGTALQLQQPVLWERPVYLVVALAALVLIGLSARQFIALRSWVVALAMAALAFASVGLRAGVFMQDALAPELEGADLALVGMVTAMPQRGEGGVRFRFRVESARLGGAAVRVPPLVQLAWYEGAMPAGDGTLELQRTAAQLRPGERWRMTARLKAPHGHANPGGFDLELWLWEQGLQATGYVRAGPRDPAPERIEATWRHPVEQMRDAVRASLFERIGDRRTAGVLAALVVGDQGAIDRADWDVFRATGVSHLMSISGLHVTMFAWLAAACIGFAWRRSPRACLRVPAQHAALVGGLILATVYALFSGWGVPAQRTIWMLAAAGVLRMSGLRWPWPVVWLGAGAVVVMIDPWALLQAGFWLSFVAVGVLFATDVPQTDAPAKGRALRRLLREQWIVTVALTPLTLLLFGQVSLVGLFANLVAIPWVTLAVTPLALLGVAAPPLWDAAAALLGVLASALVWLAALPFATVSVAAPPLWAGCAGVAGGLLLAMPWPVAVRVMGVPLVLPVMLWQPPRPAPGEFDLLAADVGQGNAVIVRTATRTLVYDAGPRYSRESDAGDRVMVPLLRRMDETVATLVLSHRDADHTGGAPAILAMQPGAALLSSIEQGHELQAIRPATRCEAGQRWTWDGVAFEVLHPRAADYAAGGRPNGISCVLRISTPNASALLAGDIEAPQEAALAPRIAPADLLLVPHHGSKTSSTDVFLDAVRPRVALVQAGYRNRFGHPAAPVARRYRDRGIPVFDSPACGAARWASSRPQDVVCERESAARYWHHRPQPVRKLLSSAHAQIRRDARAAAG